MSLATRCTSCGTVFRVVQDQLKVSEGWVRCGRCEAVFNALEGLFDLGRDSPPEWNGGPAPTLSAETAPDEEPTDIGVDVYFDPPPLPSPTAERAPAPPAATATPPATTTTAAPAPVTARAAVPSGEDKIHSSSFPSTAPAAFADLLADPIDAHLFRKRGPVTDAKVDERDRLEFSDARFDSDLFAENGAGDEDGSSESPTSGAAELPLESAHGQPEFLRRAERKARWRSGPARVALGVGSAIAAAVLLLQVGHHFRDTVAARWPSTRPMLVAWCKLADCALEAPRRIDDVLVDSTALTRATGLDAFVLSVTLKSRSTLPLATPSVDLSLTDGNGRLIARRALAPRDFGAASVLQPGSEAPLQLMLNAGSARVSGYTVEIFYP
jgi:predicted Zn finger-like uncharacterized protein